MKISIKLDRRSGGKTSKGFPIMVYATQNYKKKAFRTGYYSHDRHWNKSTAEPKTSHPDFYILSDYLDELKLNIKKVIVLSLKRGLPLTELKGWLFRANHSIFYHAAIDIFPDGYKGTKWSAVRRFNSMYPKATFDGISRQMVEKFKNQLLKNGNKPSGVDSYLRSLRALWNKLSTEPNPFSGFTISIPEKINTVATFADISILEKAKLAYRGNIGSPGHYRDYFLLMFYLGGIDPEVLAKLRYDKNVIDGRIHFNRNKGGSNVSCNILITDKAYSILKRYDCRPYLVPIYQASNYGAFVRNFNTRFKLVCEQLKLSKPLKPKTPRYTFIDRAQNLLIDERIAAQIVGHKRKTTTSLYPNAYPLSVQDAAHLKIISIDR